ncbi:SpaH/EbpB family LPXTG-anchored major pilin [Enterococcus sp. DIV0756]|uniref:SpaH/EbpB family LPXTG-anchored major pilin n=1 Tax=Enterococcus sp. DIV0756 TaxID=2774636 RepID=UPI003F685AAF
MKKRLSRMVALVFVLGTIIVGAAAGFAAPGAKPATGDLTIHKYWADSVAEISPNEHDGLELTGSEIPDNPAVSGIQFDAYRMTKVGEAPPVPPSEEDGWTYERSGDSLTVSKNGVDHVYLLALKNPDSGVDGKTDQAGLLKYTGLEAGYYYVEENLAKSKDHVVQGAGNENKQVMDPSAPFIAAVPMTNKAGTDWNSNVHVYPKNQGSNVEKKPSVPSVTIGDTVTWTISADIPENFDKYASFTIKDELDKRLTYTAGSVVVKRMTGDTEDAVLQLGTDYEVTPTAATDTEKAKVAISLTTTGIQAIGGSSSEKLVVSLATTVNGNIDHEKNENAENIIKNEATIAFDNGSGVVSEIKSSSSKIHTGEIKVEKTYSGGTVAKSAQFQLALTENDAKSENYLQVLLDPSKNYIEAIVPKGTEHAVDWIALPSHQATGEPLGFKDGKFYVESFEGLLTYTETGSTKKYEEYYLIETLAPEGYNLLDEPEKVQFADGVDDQTVLSKAIENRRGFTLPKTGGIGTILLVVVGIVLIGLAIILTMNKKKTTV